VLDEILGAPGFVFACMADPARLLGADDRTLLTGSELMCCTWSPAAQRLRITATRRSRWTSMALTCPRLAAAGHIAVLVRPDHYLFGAAAAADEVPRLVADLRRQLGAPATWR
jgi:flavoprotein hydroxylase